MTKLELIKEVAKEGEITQKAAKHAYETVESVVLEALENGEKEIKLGFATIKVIHQDERQARNPKTQEPVTVPAKNVGRIKLSIPSKEAIAQ